MSNLLRVFDGGKKLLNRHEKTLKIPSNIWLFLLLYQGLVPQAFTQTEDSIYFKNFVYHANGTLCQHTPANSSFLVFLNRDQSKILVENAPRWNLNAEPNIPGNGTFGVELANFVTPGPQVGDSVFACFTCSATGQQGVLADLINGIPWWRFPLSLTMASQIIPSAPSNVLLTVDTVTHHRIVRWIATVGQAYKVYRRVSDDTIIGGGLRMLYTRVGSNISDNNFVDSTALANKRYGYLVFAVSSQGVMSPHSREVNEDPVVPTGDDLTVGYIGRIPRLNYIWGSPDPGQDGWPMVGQTVLWQANVKNWMTRSLSNVQYMWYLDGVPVDSGSISMPAGDTVSVYHPWTWTFTRHTITFVIDPNNLVPEEEENNNSLTIYTNAIGVGLYVERSVYNYFRQYQRELPNTHSNCWEDWAQRQVRRWNGMFVSAIYPDAPNGVLDRIRLEKITIVPDNALPLAGGLPTNNPNLNDSTIDMQWGFPATLLNGTFYTNHTSTSDNNAFYYEGSLMHELGHARYLVDVYGFNVEGGTNTVAIMENGQYVAGSQYMPFVGGNSVYVTPILGLMNSQYTYIDRYSTSALNLIVGHRATYGNCNAPDNIGVFMQDLPAQNRLLVKDQSGNVLPGASVWVYQSTGLPNVWYGKYYDNTPDLMLVADSTGHVLLGRCPFSPNGQIEHTYGLSQAIIILRVAHGGRVGYGFLECSSCNFEYWRGNTTLGNYEIRFTMVNPNSVRDMAGVPPHEFRLEQNVPNPFNPTTRIRFQIPREGLVSLKVFDVLGREVTTLVNESVTPGRYETVWNAGGVASGVYFYRLSMSAVGSGERADFSDTKKLLLVR